jgi:hypothetical protein
MCKTKGVEMKKNLWTITVSFINLKGLTEIAKIQDSKLMNIISAVGMIPTAKIVNAIGERKAI